MIGWLNWVLSDVALPASATAALCMGFAWVCERQEQWPLLIRSTLFLRHVRAYEKARSRTSGGSTNSPDGRAPSRLSGATGPGVEARSPEEPPPAPPQRSVGGAAPRAVSPTGLPPSPGDGS